MVANRGQSLRADMMKSVIVIDLYRFLLPETDYSCVIFSHFGCWRIVLCEQDESDRLGFFFFWDGVRVRRGSGLQTGKKKSFV